MARTLNLERSWHGVVRTLYEPVRRVRTECGGPANGGGWAGATEPVLDWRGWGEALIAELHSLAPLPVVGIQLLDVAPAGTISNVLMDAVNAPMPWIRDAGARYLLKVDRQTIRSYFFPRRSVVSMEECLAGASAKSAAYVSGLTTRLSLSSGVSIVAHPEPGTIFCLFMMGREPIELSRPERTSLARLGIHLESSVRLHRRPETLVAVLGPEGRIEYLRDSAVDPSTCEAAAARLRHMGERSRDMGAPALGLWHGLVAGELTAVERRIGSRVHTFFLENPPHRQPLRALSAGEQDVVSMVCQGHSAKAISYGLGVAQSTVSTRLDNAAAKVGAANRMDLVRLAAMLTRDPRARFTATTLTTAERDIADLLTQGLTNEQIARIRLRSVRTIANQVSTMLRKTGAANRKSLVALKPI